MRTSRTYVRCKLVGVSKQKLKNRQAASQEWLVNCIKSQDTADIQTFEGGCEALFSWFDQFIPPRGVIEER
jgi:hypothetical protein